jgi:hypothetical protein
VSDRPIVLTSQPEIKRIPKVKTFLESISRNSKGSEKAYAMLAGKEPLGESLESWATRFWQWEIALPPGFETNQCVMYSVPNTSMIFLMNPYTANYKGNCAIPSDRYILVPLLVGECDPTVPAVKTATIEELRKCAQAADEPFKSWDVVLDDRIILETGVTKL